MFHLGSIVTPQKDYYFPHVIFATGKLSLILYLSKTEIHVYKYTIIFGICLHEFKYITSIIISAEYSSSGG